MPSSSKSGSVSSSRRRLARSCSRSACVSGSAGSPVQQPSSLLGDPQLQGLVVVSTCQLAYGVAEQLVDGSTAPARLDVAGVGLGLVVGRQLESAPGFEVDIAKLHPCERDRGDCAGDPRRPPGPAPSVGQHSVADGRTRSRPASTASTLAGFATATSCRSDSLIAGRHDHDHQQQHQTPGMSSRR